jgi:hypothetical protein
MTVTGTMTCAVATSICSVVTCIPITAPPMVIARCFMTGSILVSPARLKLSDPWHYRC